MSEYTTSHYTRDVILKTKSWSKGHSRPPFDYRVKMSRDKTIVFANVIFDVLLQITVSGPFTIDYISRLMSRNHGRLFV